MRAHPPSVDLHQRRVIFGAYTKNYRSMQPKPQRLEMIRKLPSGQYRLYSRKKNPRTGKQRNLGTFKSKRAALRHERDIQFFKRRQAN